MVDSFSRVSSHIVQLWVMVDYLVESVVILSRYGL